MEDGVIVHENLARHLWPPPSVSVACLTKVPGNAYLVGSYACGMVVGHSHSLQALAKAYITQFKHQ